MNPEQILVQVYFGPLDPDGNITRGQVQTLTIKAQNESEWLYEGSFLVEYPGRCGYAARIIPYHEGLIHTFTPPKIKWE
ncbi:MAG: hypothetical protein WBM27_13330 [bacterium]